jgi:phytoene synthase
VIDTPAFDAATTICRQHAKSFYFASHFLPEEKRLHAYAVYAFCRLLDDAVDEAQSPEQMHGQLARFEGILADCYDGKVPDQADQESLAVRAFAITIRQCQIPMKPFAELAEGCRMDLTINRYADWAGLERYCYHVAGVVGLIMCYVFGLHDPRAHGQAIAMGNAMQLTNILRDVKEDCARGRIYLPQDEMMRFGVSEQTLADGIATDSFKSLIRFQIARARALYATGSLGLCALPTDGSRQTACVMAAVYGGILGAIERLDCDVFASRAHLTITQKFLRLPAAMKLARMEYADPVPDIF